jgi:hypothetical protein
MSVATREPVANPLFERTTFSWSGTESVRDVVKEIVALKQRFQREIQVIGSCALLKRDFRGLDCREE